MPPQFDDPTFAATTSGSAAVGSKIGAIPALSIEWHPDLRRVGDIAPIVDSIVPVNRSHPTFLCPTDSGRSAPINSRRFSNDFTSFVVKQVDDQVEVWPGQDEREVLVDGAPLLAPRRFGAPALDRGVMISVGSRFAFCLHLTNLPVARGPDQGFVGFSDKMERTRRSITTLAPLDVPILIRGETGTGKELTARALVAASRRSARPFIAINMATILREMAVSELFGHVRGSFTGATADQPGKFALAHAGTLFLDEIGLAAANVQAMLLRVLETGEVWPVGAKVPRTVDVRLVAATDTSIEQAIEQGAFMAQLFHRLAGFQIELPPLRERRQDFGPLLLHMLRPAMTNHGDVWRLERDQNDAKTWLTAPEFVRFSLRTWPGNIRELSNFANQLAAKSAGAETAQLPDFRERHQPEVPPQPGSPAAPSPRPEAPRRRGKPPSPDQMEEALRRHDYKKGKAAAELGVSRTTLYSVNKKSEPPRFRTGNSIPAEELLQAYSDFGEDLDRLAEHFLISRQALLPRLKELLPPDKLKRLLAPPDKK